MSKKYYLGDLTKNEAIGYMPHFQDIKKAPVTGALMIG